MLDCFNVQTILISLYFYEQTFNLHFRTKVVKLNEKYEKVKLKQTK